MVAGASALGGCRGVATTSVAEDETTPAASGGRSPQGPSRTPPPAPSLPEPEDGPSPSADVPRYYVSPRGRDEAVCSSADPCRQIRRALELVTQAGGHVVVEDGEYAPFEVRGFAGTKASPLVVRATGTATLRVDATAPNGVVVSRSSFVYLEGFRIEAPAQSGLVVEGSPYVTARRLGIQGSGASGVRATFSDDVRLEYNVVGASLDGNGIAVEASSDRAVIRYNVVHGHRFSGIELDGDDEATDPTGLYAGTRDGLTTGAVIEANVLYENGKGGGAAINLDGVQDSRIANNVLYDNFATGIGAYGDADGVPGDGLKGGTDYDGTGHAGPSGLRVVHNTVVMPPASRRAALLLRYSSGTKKNVLRNNVLVHEGASGVALEIGFGADAALLDADKNATFGRTTTNGQASNVKGWIGDAPPFLTATAGEVRVKFVDRARGDLHLAPDAVVVDKGEPLADVTTDADGNPRVVGAGPDLGAYELVP